MIPDILIRQIKDGNVVLFLGAGATKGAIHPEGKSSPSGAELANLIVDEFLDETYRNMTLASVAEYAISESSLFSVQKFISNIFSKFEPSEESHMLIPKYRWKAIVTTNYDTIIEKSYNNSKSNVQTLAKFIEDGQSIDRAIQSPKDLPYFKLHGCINEANNANIPFILTIDQYVTHKLHRERLFSKVLDLAGNYPILFVGHSLEDPDIRAILLSLDKEIANRERSYIIIPSAKEAQKRFWEGKKISVIESTFSNFMKELEKQLGNIDFSIPKIDIEALKSKNVFFNIIDISEKKPSDDLISYLENDLDFVSPSLPSNDSSPTLFYKGISNDWYPIIESLDIKRVLEDDILAEIFLETDDQYDKSPYLYLIKGYAGTGKTILSKRIAWNASTNFNKKCFYLRSNSILRYDIIEELHFFVKERFFLFIDNASQCESDIYSLLITAKRNAIAVSIIATERTNVWNIECPRIKPFLEQAYELSYLKEREVNDLLDILGKNDCLGVLKGKSRELQLQAFNEKAGRELLVALYEATQGKSFQDIVCDEYNNIPDEAAKPLYLTVCLLHSIGSYTRAGLLNRVYDINFSDFKEKFFDPLENLVINRRDYYVNDYVYESRHRMIAEFVVSGILINEQERFDEYIRIINNLDVDYDSDKNAFLYLTNGRILLKTFRDIIKIRHIYNDANKRSIDDPKLMQQEAIFEMTAPGGSLKRAEELLKKADELTNSSDVVILHSLSELKYNLAEKSTNILEKRKYFNETETICKSLLSRGNVHTAHPYHTIIKSKLSMLKTYIDEQELTPVEKLTKEIEKYIAMASQAFPEEAFIIEANANFNSLINNAPKAKELLESAYEQNNKSPYLAARLAAIYDEEKNIDKAISTLKTTLSAQPNDKDLNYKMGLYLSIKSDTDLNDILYYLRRSFTRGDNRYHAQFWYARALYLQNQIPDSLEIFKGLKSVRIDPQIKNYARGSLTHEYSGIISNLNLNSGYIKRDIYGDRVFFFRNNEKGEFREDLKRHTMVKFKLAFNYFGPIAVDITTV